jgi:hypothetical protein
LEIDEVTAAERSAGEQGKAVANLGQQAPKDGQISSILNYCHIQV